MICWHRAHCAAAASGGGVRADRLRVTGLAVMKRELQLRLGASASRAATGVFSHQSGGTSPQGLVCRWHGTCVPESARHTPRWGGEVGVVMLPPANCCVKGRPMWIGQFAPSLKSMPPGQCGHTRHAIATLTGELGRYSDGVDDDTNWARMPDGRSAAAGGTSGPNHVRSALVSMLAAVLLVTGTTSGASASDGW